MKKIKLSLRNRSYNIIIGKRLLNNCGNIFKKSGVGKDALVITNRRLLALAKRTLSASLKRAGISIRFELVPDSERAKSVTVATNIINRISSYDRKKKIFIVAFGGGVIGDLAGFIAAVYKRGVPYVQIPTTLLAQVDSAIGGKVAVDLPLAKNLIGAFYQPSIVLSDISLLRSLDKRQIVNGLAEIIKYGVIEDKTLFEYLEKKYTKILGLDDRALEFVIARSSKIKAHVVETDELDNKGLRVVLNYGHTIGHAIESAAGYTKKFYHGEAIAIGMIAASRISTRLGLLPAEDGKRIETLISTVGLPTGVKGLKFSKIYGSHLHDKKFINKKNRFVLPLRIGKVKVVEGVPENVVKHVLRSILAK